MSVLPFEKSVRDLQLQIQELQRYRSDNPSVQVDKEIHALTEKNDKLLKKIYAHLDPWEKVQVARHAQRPHALNYITTLIDNFTPLAGDRVFGEDAAVVAGIGRFKGRSVAVLGTEKGHDTATRLHYNFGMAKPEGYRKAQRLMAMANHFDMPLLTFVDTNGAYPGIDAEERGQAQAIAKCIEVGLSIENPFVSVIIGEGGSGGAIALATSDSVLMLEHAIYSVISPEGCASILWRDDKKNADAARALHLTAQDLFALKIIDGIVAEPLGGAHRQPDVAMKMTGDAIENALMASLALDPAQRVQQRRAKFLAMGRIGIS